VECPNCHLDQNDGNTECPRCGVIYRKYRQRPSAESVSMADPGKEEQPPEKISVFRLLADLFFEVDTNTNIIYFIGRVLVLAGLLGWGGLFIFSSPSDAGVINSLWHLVDLPFHEAGHIFFRFMGSLMTSLGGSLFQLMMPLICGSVLLVKTRDPFGASVCLWWTGENFLDLAPYINDARSLSLPLLGGNTGQTSPYGFHDWEFILTETGLLPYDHAFAWGAHILGSFFMVLALTWGAVVLYKQYRWGWGHAAGNK
jgi:hypothetical protein